MDQLWQTSPHEPAWQSSPVPSVPTVRSSAILSSATASLLTYTGLLQDLSDRFDAVLEAIEATDGWVTNRVTPGKIILGELGGIEAGLRQLKAAADSERADVASEVQALVARSGMSKQDFAERIGTSRSRLST